MKSIIESFKNKTILVIGDIMLDNYIFGETNRISPEAPVPIVNIKYENSMLGGAANVIDNLIALGAKAIPIGFIGSDFNGKKIKHLLEKINVTSEYLIEIPKFPTITKNRIICQNQQVIRFDKESIRFIEREFLQDLCDNINYCMNTNNIDGIIISDYGKGVISNITMNIDDLNTEIPIFIDPKPKNFKLYKNIANVITPNYLEAMEITGTSLIFAGYNILKSLNCDHVIITKGKKGMTIFSKDKNHINIPTIARNVYDVTGCGDTVISVITLAMISGLDIQSSCIMANWAASKVIQEIGTATISNQELINLMGLNNE